MVAQPEVGDPALQHQAVLLALAACNVGVCAAGDDVEDVGMALDDCRQRVEHHLDPLTGREEAEGAEHETGVDARRSADACLRRLARGAPASSTRRAVRDDVDLLGRARSDLDEQALRGLGHHDHALGLGAERRDHTQLVRGRLGEDGVQRDDERLRQLAREREDVLPVLAPEDAVLVLEQDDVDVGPGERAGRGRSRRARPGRPCGRFPAAASSTARRRRRRGDLLHVGDAEQRPPMSKEKVPIPHARGGYVEKIAVRTWVRPFRQMSDAYGRAAGWIGSAPA